MKGQIISGRFGEIWVRKKSSEDIELGELLIANTAKGKILLQAYDLLYGSQISKQRLELISGMSMEGEGDFEFLEPELRNYTLAVMKNLVYIQGKRAISSKALPDFFSEVREVTNDDLSFLTKPQNPIFLGKLRSGSRSLDVPIYLEGKKMLTHHVLISGTTGKGKSVLMSNLLWNVAGKAGLLVLDPHDEYYGKDKVGLKDFPAKEKVVYYGYRDVPRGERTLRINLKSIKPDHFACLDFSPPQKQAMNAYFKEYGKKWVEAVVLDKKVKVDFNESSIGVLRRRMMQLLDLDFAENQLYCNGIFDLNAGEAIISEISAALEDSSLVIIDTSGFSGHVELLIGSIITAEIFSKYRKYKREGTLKDKPVISIVLEEAPRVLGKEVLEKGTNIFSTIAREGRKFNVGLIAITQLPSLIPRQILANMNTKIILGTEMNSERQAIIESASQDLSQDSRSIASLDKGEAIVSSNFAPFALPLHIPFFDEEVKKEIEKHKKQTKVTDSFSGVKLS
ncbi:MAG: ATP-binding protein [Nanoarchaeota archaeon]|nr:ATP-binding protein [Nanoarchaeota archaeon]